MKYPASFHGVPSICSLISLIPTSYSVAFSIFPSHVQEVFSIFRLLFRTRQTTPTNRILIRPVDRISQSLYNIESRPSGYDAFTIYSGITGLLLRVNSNRFACILWSNADMICPGFFSDRIHALRRSLPASIFSASVSHLDSFRQASTEFPRRLRTSFFLGGEFLWPGKNSGLASSACT